MEFIAAGEIIGEAHQVRTVGLKGRRQMPDGNYRFIDMYCIDPSCDCRKTMIQVFLDDVHVSTINYGWEPEAYYREWLGFPEDEVAYTVMSGASIDITSPNKVSPGGMLAFFNSLLDDRWLGKLKSHYAAVKQKLAREADTEETNS